MQTPVLVVLAAATGAMIVRRNVTTSLETPSKEAVAEEGDVVRGAIGGTLKDELPAWSWETHLKL